MIEEQLTIGLVVERRILTGNWGGDRVAPYHGVRPRTRGRAVDLARWH